MGYASVIAAVYLLWFMPGFFSRPLLVMPLASLSALILLKAGRDALPVMVASLAAAASAAALSASLPDIPAERWRIDAVWGTVVQDSQQKKGRTSGFRMELERAADGSEAVFSADGIIYVVSSQADLYAGDRIIASGYFHGDVFRSHSVELLARPFHAGLRSRCISRIKERLRETGEAGELASLLLLGTGSDGSFALSSDARASGLSHVLALSGMHLSILAFIISPFLERILGRKKGRAATDAVLFLFSFLSGWRPSLMRAFIFRVLLSKGMGMETSFVLSFVILLMVFPSASQDIGAIYSFLCLGGIFILSDRLDRALRFFLPLPYPVSVSIAASASALIFSVPLTISVFGSYQLGAIVTSFPFNAAISVYMGLSLLALAIPHAGILLRASYRLIAAGFAAAGRLPESEGLLPYLLLASMASAIMFLHSAILRIRSRSC